MYGRNSAMKKLSFWVTFLFSLCLFVGTGLVHAYQPPPSSGAAIAPVPSPTVFSASGLESLQPQAIAMEATEESSDDESEDTEDTKLQPFSNVLKGTRKMGGLFTLYRNKDTGKIYAEIQPDQLNRNYLATITLESGVGEGGLYSGMPAADFLFQFRRVNRNLHFVVPNTYFRTRAGDPQQRSIKRSFSDSTLAALPIKSIHPERKSILVELGPLFLNNDLPNLTPLLSEALGSGYALDPERSYFGTAKTFPQNVELESVYGFTSGGNGGDFMSYLPTLPDSRGLSLRVRYSLSQLPEKNGYRPRLADNRVGYFITAFQDFSDDNRPDPFVRYINRWHLEKQDPTAALSPPVKPITFWIENTVPLEYREPIREGVLMWNKAFEKIGYKDAIVVNQMPDKANWDPADVRYNTIRWFNSFDGAFAMGPSRVNPLTGEILDADIIVDANFVRYVKQAYRIFAEQNQSADGAAVPQSGSQSWCADSRLQRYLQQQNTTNRGNAEPVEHNHFVRQMRQDYDLCYGLESSRQFAMGALSLSFFQNVTPSSDEMQKYVSQFLRELMAHEVGHTLGLRHNFHGSTMLKAEQLNNTEITQSQGLVGSVMDYNPPNIAPKGVEQGDYFTALIGPYDEWAIEYGYTLTDAIVPQAERRSLEKIAQRSPEPALAYATDEDWFAFLDPTINMWDLSSNTLTYTRWQLDNAREIWSRLDKRYPVRGDSYSEVRDIFDTVLFSYLIKAMDITPYIGGQSINRHGYGDPEARLPFEPIPLETQRQALAMLQQYVFNEQSFQFPPDLLNKLAPSRWRHWGTNVPTFRLDYPIHDRIFLLQSIVLNDLLSNERLARLRDTELKTQPGQALTLPELFDTIQTSVWKEVTQPEGELKLSSLRRALQREHLGLLTNMVLRNSDVPEDARTLAWYQLRQLHGALQSTLRKQGRQLDTYTKAHLEETSDRIAKALDAQLRSQ